MALAVISQSLRSKAQNSCIPENVRDTECEPNPGFLKVIRKTQFEEKLYKAYKKYIKYFSSHGLESAMNFGKEFVFFNDIEEIQYSISITQSRSLYITIIQNYIEYNVEVFSNDLVLISIYELNDFKTTLEFDLASGLDYLKKNILLISKYKSVVF